MKAHVYLGKPRVLWLAILILVSILTRCEKGPLDLPPRPQETSEDELDVFISENFIEKYGIDVNYHYDDQLLAGGRRGVPIRYDAIMPVLNFILKVWIEPFTATPEGEEFFGRSSPTLIVLYGGYFWRPPGIATAGFAESGVQVSLANMNDLDFEDAGSLSFVIHTLYHEFAHNIHQQYNLPPGYEEITPKGYTTSGAWRFIRLSEAISEGFVSPYATSSPNEDYAEVFGHLIADPDFDQEFITPVNCGSNAACLAREEGKALIKIKVGALKAHFFQVSGLKTEDLHQDAMEALNSLVSN